MIIDSHAHYAHTRFDNEFPYLYADGGDYAIARADREDLFARFRESGICGIIEPSIGFDDIEKQLAIVADHRDFLWAAVGVHPTRCFRTAWANRRKLKGFAAHERVIAIGETGLDYHYPRRKQHRFRQKRWFVYQIKLADTLKLPLVLHIRAADRDALKILRRYSKRLHGGVVHCFAGDAALAKKYVDLGFALGIGGKLLCEGEEGRALCDAVKHVPLDCLIVETDAPFVLPDLGNVSCASGNQRRKLCNSSLILPNVIGKIAEIRGEPADRIEEAVYLNTVRTFDLKSDSPGG